MSYSPLLGSSFNRTKLRDPAHVSTFSGMCSMCTADCVGTCEIGISAVRGADAVYPTTTGDNQVASEKVYPIDYSHFNIRIGCVCNNAPRRYSNYYGGYHTPKLAMRFSFLFCHYA